MKKLVVLVFLVGTLFSKGIDVTVSIMPQKYMVEKIGKDLVNVNLMVKPGESPHTYEPKPKQMTALGKSKIYFAIGVEFEKVWLHKFEDLNPQIKIVHVDHGISKIEMGEHHHHGDEEDHDEHEKHHEHHDDHDDHEKHADHEEHGHHKGHEGHGHHEHEEGHGHHHHGGEDPHIWTSPFNGKIIAKNILNALIEVDGKNRATYQKNYQAFIQELNKTDKEIKKILKNHKGKAFAVFHPAWGYFAKRYNLKQIAIEIEGKSPKAKELIEVIKELKEKKVRVLFTQPEFSKKAAGVVAKEINGNVVVFSPLNKHYLKNLLNLAKAIDKGYKK